MHSVDVLGIEITAASIEELNAIIRSAVTGKERWILANHNLHSVYLYHRDPKLRRFFADARLAHIDGMSLVFLARLLGYPLSREQRVTYVDWIRPLMAEAEESRWRIFFLGSKPGVGEAAATALTQEFPQLELAVHHGYFDRRPGSAENGSIIKTINEFRPQILMVGLGMPRQEHWILDHLEKLDVNVILPAGACMDYVAGAVPTPPRWMGRVGLEWLYRLGSEPRRLAIRYLVEPWFVAGLLVNYLLRRKLPRGRGGC
jgi:N-acetylglucosaminyldiphosphoundecaprenol N-acetyl-beta-D-mannosaminyltransferase